MPLRPGELLEHYEVIEMIGSGGMGEVYRARDTRLPREVAIKVSSLAFNDRFAREARVIASLNHPNICTLFDVGPNYIVMELVQGDTLQDMIGKGSIPLDEASRLAKQIADALDYAHEHGVVHRDLKPANIKVRPDGVVKVLDFGMAKALQTASADEMPTVSMDATQAGSILGTPNYMSPEQAMGRSADKRADTWAFGIVFYEMLAGEKPFGGSTVQEAIAATLRDAPDLNKVPLQVRRLLRKCLEKDPQNRLKHLGDVMSLIDEAPSVELPVGSVAAPIATARKTSWLWPAVAALGFAAAAALATIHFREVPEKRSAARFEFGIPQGTLPTLSGGFSISPDGENILFSASDEKGSHWYLRRMDSTEARMLAFPVGNDPLPAGWSPDGRFIAYNQGEGVAKGDVATGQATTLCGNCTGLGVSWGTGGTILLGNVSSIALISENGGALTDVIKVDRSKGEVVVFPAWLDDGKHFVYTMAVTNGGTFGLRIGSVDAKPEDQSKDWLLEGAANAAWVPPAAGQPGYLVYVSGTNDLVARPFDAGKRVFLGEPVQLASSLFARQNWLWAAFSAARNGQLIYRHEGGRQQQLTWFDRSGKNLGASGSPGTMQTVVLSPDGTRAALGMTQNGPQDIWIADLTAGTRTRLTSEPVPDQQPVWSRDGASIFYASARVEGWSIVRRASSGAQGEQILHTFEKGSTAAGNLTDASPDGKLLVYHRAGSKGGTDLWTLDISKPDSKPEVLLQTDFQEIAARFSPDGKWFIYRSNESGRNEIYAQAVPGYGAPAGKWLISRDGAIGMARWRKDGREVLFLAPGGSVMAADVTLSPAFQAGPPRKLFDVPPAFRALFAGGQPGSLVDMTPDAQRFLFALPLSDSGTVPFQVTTDFRTGLTQ